MYHSDKGRVLKKLGKFEEALSCYDVIIWETPHEHLEASALNEAEILKEIKKPNEALVCYNKILKLYPCWGKALENKIDLLEKIGSLNNDFIYGEDNQEKLNDSELVSIVEDKDDLKICKNITQNLPQKRNLEKKISNEFSKNIAEGAFNGFATSVLGICLSAGVFYITDAMTGYDSSSFLSNDFKIYSVLAGSTVLGAAYKSIKNK